MAGIWLMPYHNSIQLSLLSCIQYKLSLSDSIFPWIYSSHLKRIDKQNPDLSSIYSVSQGGSSSSSRETLFPWTFASTSSTSPSMYALSPPTSVTVLRFSPQRG
jgi:hypothetical protein